MKTAIFLLFSLFLISCGSDSESGAPTLAKQFEGSWKLALDATSRNAASKSKLGNISKLKFTNGKGSETFHVLGFDPATKKPFVQRIITVNYHLELGSLHVERDSEVQSLPIITISPQAFSLSFEGEDIHFEKLKTN